METATQTLPFSVLVIQALGPTVAGIATETATLKIKHMLHLGDRVGETFKPFMAMHQRASA